MSAVQSDASAVLPVNKLNMDAGLLSICHFPAFRHGMELIAWSEAMGFFILRHKCGHTAYLCGVSIDVSLRLSSVSVCIFFPGFPSFY